MDFDLADLPDDVETLPAIAVSCGFRSSSNFSRVFAETFRQTPRARRAGKRALGSKK
jgi:transcriptional regulator GlxA family with amidase domain